MAPVDLRNDFEGRMRTLIYKRTHEGDPDPATGVFGNHNCMKSVRAWNYEAVIGIGGNGPEPRSKGIAEKVTWIGIGPTKDPGDGREPLVTFRKFIYFGTNGPAVADLAPRLASRIYANNVRVLMDKVSGEERAEIDRILDLARTAPQSGVSAGAASAKARSRRGAC